MTKEATKAVTIIDVLEVVTTYGWVRCTEYEYGIVGSLKKIREVSLPSAIILAVARKMMNQPEPVAWHYYSAKEILLTYSPDNYRTWKYNYHALVDEISLIIQAEGFDLVRDFNLDMDCASVDQRAFNDQMKELGYSGIQVFNDEDSMKQSRIEAILS